MACLPLATKKNRYPSDPHDLQTCHQDGDFSTENHAFIAEKTKTNQGDSVIAHRNTNCNDNIGHLHGSSVIPFKLYAVHMSSLSPEEFGHNILPFFCIEIAEIKKKHLNVGHLA